MYLEVMPTGSKYWRLKYRYGGKEKRLAFGVYPVVSIAAAAREKARLAKAELAEGNDPSEVKKQQKLAKQASINNSFEAIAHEFIEKRKAEGAAQVTLDKLNWIVEKKLCPFIGSIPVSKITPVQILTA